MVIVLATRNAHKVKEIRSLLGSSIPNLTIKTLDDFPTAPEVDETEPTLEGNALRKARAVFQATNLPSLADDSGLEVFYLTKRPGVLSARYSGPQATYEANNQKLLMELKGVPPRRRNAQFRCVIAFVSDDGEKIVEGVTEGKITESPRGNNGFGYDPIFQPNGFQQTYAEMTSELKNRISHRGKAIEKLKPLIEEYSRTHASV
jgi:XTP/dITP diphosphohydrolase